MSDKIAVYIVSMGETPEAVRTFVSAFAARFKIPPERVLALSKKLPAKIGTYDIDRAKQFGIEIKRMGGQVSLRRIVAPEAIPVPPPAAESPDNSWVVHGHSESQDELRDMTAAQTGNAASQEPPPEYPAGMADDDVPPAFVPPPERKIDGRFEAKQVYTTEQAFGLNEEHFKKVKELYAGKKYKKSVLKSPAVKAIFVIVLVVLGVLAYQHREDIETYFFGLKEAVLLDAYESRLPAHVAVPKDLTGNYTGEMKYTTEQGDIAFVDVTLFIDGMNVHDVVVEVSSSTAEIGTYQLRVEYAPGYVSYTKTINDTVAYVVESTFPSSNNTVARIDERGRFSLELDALEAGVDPNSVPATEKDHLGNTIFIKMEGGFAGNDEFYGGFLTSGSPLVGWETKKK